MAVELVYETHSITVDNERGFCTGWLPGELSEGGRRAALELGKRRRNNNIASVFVSDLRRAIDTAEIAFQNSGIPIRHDWRLRECNYGELNGKPAPEVQSQRRRRIDEPYPGGESYRQVVDRMRSLLKDLAAEYKDRRVLLIGHAATRYTLNHLIHNVALEDLVDERFCWQPGWEYTLSDDVTCSNAVKRV